MIQNLLKRGQHFFGAGIEVLRMIRPTEKGVGGLYCKEPLRGKGDERLSPRDRQTQD